MWLHNSLWVMPLNGLCFNRTIIAMLLTITLYLHDSIAHIQVVNRVEIQNYKFTNKNIKYRFTHIYQPNVEETSFDTWVWSCASNAYVYNIFTTMTAHRLLPMTVDHNLGCYLITHYGHILLLCSSLCSILLQKCKLQLRAIWRFEQN